MATETLVSALVEIIDILQPIIDVYGTPCCDIITCSTSEAGIKRINNTCVKLWDKLYTCLGLPPHTYTSAAEEHELISQLCNAVSAWTLLRVHCRFVQDPLSSEPRVNLPSFIVECGLRLLAYELSVNYTTQEFLSHDITLFNDFNQKVPVLDGAYFESIHATRYLLEKEVFENKGSASPSIWWNVYMSCVTCKGKTSTIDLISLREIEILCAQQSSLAYVHGYLHDLCMKSQEYFDNFRVPLDPKITSDDVYVFSKCTSTREKSDEYDRFSRAFLMMVQSYYCLPEHIVPSTCTEYMSKKYPDMTTALYELCKPGTNDFDLRENYTQHAKDASLICLFDYYCRQTLDENFVTKYFACDVSPYRLLRCIRRYCQERMKRPPGLVILTRKCTYLLLKDDHTRLQCKDYPRSADALAAWLLHVEVYRRGKLSITKHINPLVALIREWADAFRTNSQSEVASRHVHVGSKPILNA